MNRQLVIAALAAICLVAPAAAQTSDRSVAVRHADINLSRSRDVVRLDRRIARAAANLCALASSFDLEGRLNKNQCVESSIAAARIQRDRAVARFKNAQHASAR